MLAVILHKRHSDSTRASRSTNSTIRAWFLTRSWMTQWPISDLRSRGSVGHEW